MSDELPEVPEASDLSAGERLVWFGPPGPPGDRGLPGLDGVAGVAGATGATGATGPAGPSSLIVAAGPPTTISGGNADGSLLWENNARQLSEAGAGLLVYFLNSGVTPTLRVGNSTTQGELALGTGSGIGSGVINLLGGGQVDPWLSENEPALRLAVTGVLATGVIRSQLSSFITGANTPPIYTDVSGLPWLTYWLTSTPNGVAINFMAQDDNGTLVTWSLPAAPGPGSLPGPVGPRGQDGNRWWSGQGAPALATGVVNDFYLDQRSGSAWQKQARDLMPPAWVRIAALLGPQGPAGTTGLPGTAGAPGLPGAPGSSGQAGAAGVNGMPLLGPRGQDGASWFSGAGVPAPALGRVQDYYLQTAADPGRVWQKQVSQFGAPPSWVRLLSLLGPAGGKGATGPAGPQGLVGPAGATGPAGSAASAANDFGDGSDGAGSFTDGATHTLATTTGVDDTGIVLKQYTTLTITGASTIVTAANRAQVMVIKVQGNCTIGNGSGGALNMDLRGAAATPSQAIALARNLSNLWSEKVAQVFTVPLAGAAGGAGATTGAATVGGTGSAGSAGQTGGGGGGAGGAGGAGNGGNGGNGAAGTCFCGGSGGGAGSFTGAVGVSGSDGAANGGQGGNSGTGNAANRASGAGAGNPVGTGNAGSGASVTAPTGGGGGTLILIVGGNLTIGAAGLISANGGGGGGATASTRAFGGGGAGGGSVIVLYAGTLSNSGTIQASGGAAGSATTAGGAGGAGSVQGPTQISNP